MSMYCIYGANFQFAKLQGLLGKFGTRYCGSTRDVNQRELLIAKSANLENNGRSKELG